MKKRLTVKQRQALIDARIEASMTIPQLAVLVGVNPSTVYRWESGESYPSQLALKALAEKFPKAELTKQEPRS